MGQNLLRLAAKKERLDAAPAVRSHDDQVATPFLRRRDAHLWVALHAQCAGRSTSHCTSMGPALQR